MPGAKVSQWYILYHPTVKVLDEPGTIELMGRPLSASEQILALAAEVLRDDVRATMEEEARIIRDIEKRTRGRVPVGEPDSNEVTDVLERSLPLLSPHKQV